MGQLNTILNPCGKVPCSVAQDSSIEMGCNDEIGRFHILSLNVLMYFYICIVHTFPMSCFFDDRTEQRKQDMRDMSQTFVLVRIWNESLSGSELC